jgi:peptidoglycan/LPS O-acetylase OafA/YrhL
VTNLDVPAGSARRDIAVQSLRGVAVLLMVMGHVIGSDATRGLRVGDESWWRLSYLFLEDLRMPLFATISGVVYAFRPVMSNSGQGDLIRGKVRRLLVPLVVVGTVLFATKLVVPHVNQRPDPRSFWRIYLFPFEHLWFLQAIFLVFVVVALLDAGGRLASPRSWAPTFGAACVLSVVVQLPSGWEVFSADGMLRLLPFFLGGLGLWRFRETIDQRRWLLWSLPAFAAVYSLRLALLLAHMPLSWSVDRALSVTVGLAGLLSIFLARHTVQNRILAWIGGYSFGVYLLHVFAVAATRMALDHLGVRSEAALFGVCLLAGVTAPIVFEMALGTYGFVSWSVLGQKPRPRRAPLVRGFSPAARPTLVAGRMDEAVREAAAGH